MSGLRRRLSAAILLITLLTEVSAIYKADNQACEIQKDNLLMSVPGVSSPKECRQICRNNNNCNYFSNFGRNSFPFKEVCTIFSNCTKLHSCEDCMTEDTDFCHKACNDNVVGEFGENIVELIPGVEEEVECRMNCMNNSNCNYYTYFSQSDPRYPNLCVLLAKIVGPVKSCQHCSTGTQDCCSKRFCGFYLDNKPPLVESLIFNDISVNSTVRIISVGSCEVSIVGIGGGGDGGVASSSDGSRMGGGGGSGQVSMVSYQTKGSTNLLISVGKNGEPSTVMTHEGDTVILALPGEDGEGQGLNGGKGYSGGGGANKLHYGGWGGTDGGDGIGGRGKNSGYGGKGSGLKISEFGLKRFTLTPGIGSSNYANCGGGGGGVLINGSGPKPKGKGEGFGGGNNGCKYSSSVGSPGAVIMEMKK